MEKKTDNTIQPKPCEKLFTLRYKTRAGQPLECIVSCKNLETANTAVHKWCNLFGHRFISIKPFIRDIAKETQAKLDEQKAAEDNRLVSAKV